MVKCSSLITALTSFLLLVLQDLEKVHALGCYGSLLNGNRTYFQNRYSLFSTLASKVVANGGFYNASLGKNPNRVHALVLCARGYEQQACISCVEKVTQEIQSGCSNQMNSFNWDNDDGDHVSCLVRSSNQSTFKNFQLVPAVIYPSPLSIEPSKDLTLFSKQWEAMVNRTVQAAMEAETSSILKYYSAVEAEFTEFPSVYMLMQCTPDITSQECKICLEKSGTYFKKQFWGRQGGEVSRPSCVFRWDLYAFHGAFDNITRVPLLPGGQTQSQAHPPSKESSIKDKKGRSIGNGGIVSIVVPALVNMLVFVGLIKLYARRRQFNNIINGNVGTAEYSDGQLMLRFDLGMILMATNGFSSENTLGQGGFGTVYKGTLPNGQEIAVKRLTKGSGQGDMEFKNEVSLLTRLQHKNLVKLLGFCNEGDEEVLVYEFVPNSSLDHFIFDEEKRSFLTWEVRCKIIEGIARGLLYLHEDSQLKIIHRDLKASNILLDAEMNPKVADFGTARLFHTDETRAETRRIAGTRGYMAPEYVNHGQISAKSDVYSFGVMLLEMVSGKRNKSFEGEGVAAFAWKRWVEGRPEIIIDPFLVENPSNEIIKLIKIGLLCVQENATKRPTMSLVIVWLGSESPITIPLPTVSAFTSNQSQSEDGMMSMSNAFTELSFR
ncbi:putative cysteine-rich receptor-like protein kinase 39 [Raphanus sativus]|uniref:Cysteine-rich receptor-like protein kinase 39 n=1 Tax=Raphanus sativus TaxID=3726 RepID=A0A6J0L4D5_RAPSA|nr:putative cysteine-rich receptor-like protein kinase 39 [Raphanus sativus]